MKNNTNPPFSLFREYIKQLMDYNKKFIVIGNGNAVLCKEIFPYIKNNQIWLGHKSFSGGMDMYAGPSYEAEKCKHPKFDENGRVIINVMMCVWYTNVEHAKHHTPIDLYKRYSNEYPKYDNIDAIEVNKVSDIPYDYNGYMGVPITFLDKYCPEQFEILDLLNRYMIFDYFGVNEDVAKRHSHCCNVNGKSVYTRILIRKRTA